MTRHLDLRALLRADAVVNAAGGLGLLLAAPALAGPLGVVTLWPLRAVGALLLLNGVEHWLVARATPSRTAVTVFAATDLVFATAMLVLAIGDPTGADTWLRWTLAVLGDLSAVVGVTKLVLLRRTTPAFADATV